MPVLRSGRLYDEMKWEYFFIGLRDSSTFNECPADFATLSESVKLSVTHARRQSCLCANYASTRWRGCRWKLPLPVQRRRDLKFADLPEPAEFCNPGASPRPIPIRVDFQTELIGFASVFLQLLKSSRQVILSFICAGWINAPLGSRIFLRELFDDVVGRIAALAGRMAKATRAVLVRPVKNHIVVMIGRRSHRHGIELQLMAYLPSHYVVGTRSVAAQAKSTHNFSFGVIERQAAAKDDYTSNGLSHHGIFRGSERRSGSEDSLRIRGRARGKTVKTLSRLRSRKEIGCGAAIVPSETARLERTFRSVRRSSTHRS